MFSLAAFSPAWWDKDASVFTSMGVSSDISKNSPLSPLIMLKLRRSFFSNKNSSTFSGDMPSAFFGDITAYSHHRSRSRVILRKNHFCCIVAGYERFCFSVRDDVPAALLKGLTESKTPPSVGSSKTSIRLMV